MARSQVLQALPVGDLQHQEDNDRKPKGKAQVEVEQVSVRYQSQGDDPEESGQGVDRSKPNEQDELLLEGNLVEVNVELLLQLVQILLLRLGWNNFLLNPLNQQDLL